MKKKRGKAPAANALEWRKKLSSDLSSYGISVR